MVIDVTLPQLGESVTEGTVTKWLVREGDVVTKDQPLLEVATDKADAEVPAPVGGRVVKLVAKEGDVVPVKSVLAQIEEGAGAAASPTGAASPALAAPLPDADLGAARGALAPPAVRREARHTNWECSCVAKGHPGGA